MMEAEKKEELRELIEEMRNEAEGNRERYYEIYGSAIQGSLRPLADLFELNLETNPELVERALKNFSRGY